MKALPHPTATLRGRHSAGVLRREGLETRISRQESECGCRLNSNGKIERPTHSGLAVIATIEKQLLTRLVHSWDSIN